jgi:hypothetical protein
MYRKWFILGPLVALVVIGALVMGGLLVYRVGWTQGSLSSPVEEGGEGGEGLRLLTLVVRPGACLQVWHAPSGLRSDRQVIILSAMEDGRCAEG